MADAIKIETSSDEESPKKYIRTFAGDIETLQKGGVPDLTPLEPTAREKLVAASPISATVPTPETVPPPTPEPFSIAAPEVPKPAPLATPLETYAGDFSDRMKETQASAATVLAAEQDSGPRPTLVQAPPEKWSKSSIIYTSIGGVLVLAGIIGAGISYLRYLSATAPVTVAPTVTAPIFVDERESISGTGTALTQAVVQSTARMIGQGSVRLLYLGNATTTNVFSALPLSAPGALLRNINSAESMAGVVNGSGTQSPFFILSVTAYSETFAGMLAWERSMPFDLGKLYPAYPAPVSNTTATSTATSSPQTTTPPVPTVVSAFHDEVVSNHDVRVYRDSGGRSLFLYGYWNQSTLVIARDPAAFTEIVQRLATSRTTP